MSDKGSELTFTLLVSKTFIALISYAQLCAIAHLPWERCIIMAILMNWLTLNSLPTGQLNHYPS